MTSFGPVWELVQRVPALRRRVNHWLIDRAVRKMPPRPNPWSTKHPYPSWDSLTDRTYSSRHLPPVRDQDRLPDPETVADSLFMRREVEGEPHIELCPKSTVLFQYFAQWVTDGFLRSDRSEPPDPAKNESNHEVDLVQVYGLNPRITRLLRAGRGGLLKHQVIDGEEYPPFLCEGGRIKPEFRGGSGSRGVEVVRFDQVPPERRDRLFALGSDTGNLQVGFVMMSVLFLREHNRIARRLADEYASWDDERLFQTARNILIVILIKIVVEEYINHIAPYHFRFRADPVPFGTEPWYRPNWMAIEFNLLYRWHTLPPSHFRIAGSDYSVEETIFNPELVVQHGLAQLFEDASEQRAGKVGLFNTARQAHLRQAIVNTIHQGRAVGVAPYNDYREHCGFPRITAFDQISGDPNVQRALREVYGRVDRIEFYPGLFAEECRPNSVLPSLMGRMVGVDAFSQALTNPLLAPRVFNERTFTPLGMRLIAKTDTLSDLLHRNVPDSSGARFVSMTRRGWRRV